jgi:NADH-quinone oxidoreductase subunit L
MTLPALLTVGAGAAPVSVQAGGAFDPILPGLILLLPLLGFAVNGVLALVSGSRSATLARTGDEAASHTGPKPLTHRLPTWVGPGVMGLAFVLTLVNFLAMLGAGPGEPVIRSYWTWMVTGTLSLEAAIQLDPLSMVMMMVVTGVGFLIHLFSVGYMKEDPGYPRYFAYLNLFVFFMLVLVMGASYPVMFVGWEGVGLCSYLLIGFWFQDREKSDAGKKAFIVNRVGDFGFLIAIFLLFTSFGALDYVSIFEAAPETLLYGGGIVTAITLFLLLGAVGKSAQIPLHVWLPDAMAGPTPVSALIHAATMVTAGVYLVARSGVLFALAPAGAATVAVVGAATALFAATIALQQYDIKKVLAYSTVSQLGFMFLGVGVGAYAAGVFHLMTHAFFKALLFLGAGAVIHSMHHALHATHKDDDAQDMRNMGGLRRFMPVTWITMWVATLAIAGIWPFAGFFSKDEIIWYAGAAAGGVYGTLFTVLWGMALAAAILTAIYMTRLMVMTFHGANRIGSEEEKHLHEAPWVMTVPLGILAVLSVVGGWINVPGSVRDSVFGGFGALPMSAWLDEWLHPVTGAAEAIREAQMGAYASVSPVGGGHVAWAAIATGMAMVVVILTALAVSRKQILTAAEDPGPQKGVRKFLLEKWYVDELYDRIIVRPIVGGSRALWRWVDQVLIDGTVNAVGMVSRGVGWVGSLFQTGQVNTYIFILTLGALAILGSLLL